MKCLMMPRHKKKPRSAAKSPTPPWVGFHDAMHRAAYSDFARLVDEGRLSDKDADVHRHQADAAAAQRQAAGMMGARMNVTDRMTATEIADRRIIMEADPIQIDQKLDPWNMERHETNFAPLREVRVMPKPNPPPALDTPGKRSIILPP